MQKKGWSKEIMPDPLFYSVLTSVQEGNSVLEERQFGIIELILGDWDCSCNCLISQTEALDF